MERVELANRDLSAVFVPALGGKMVSLVHRVTGREWLLQPPEPERGYRAASLGASFENFDTSGFDECFPTVSACRVDGVELPDHGELWSAPWSCDRRGDALALRVECRTMPCTFEKSVRLEGSTVVIDYRLTSRANEPLAYLWSSHPLLSVEPGARIFLPGEVREVYVNWSRDERLGSPGASAAWPVARTPAGEVDLSLVGPRTLGYADKLYTGRLARGWCALWAPGADAGLTFRFDPAAVPYVGLWICQGGWPTSRPPKHYTLALEPCSGRPDALETAIARGEASRIAPGETRTWTLMLALCSGRPEGDA